MKSRHTPKTASRPATGFKRQEQTETTGEPGRKPVELSLEMPQARSVAVAGTFNDWDSKRTPLRKSEGGAWKTTLSLAPGRYEYRFVIDGQWSNDPKAAESVGNAFGSTNSVLVV